MNTPPPNLPFTPDRLEAALRRHFSDDALTLRELRDEGSVRGGGRDLLTFTAEYDAADGAGEIALIFKPAYADDSPLADDPVLVGSDRREVSFYQELSANVPLTTPALIDSDLDAGWLLLERLPDSGVDRHKWQPAHYRRAITDLAKLHAQFWGGHDLWQHDFLWRPTDHDLLDNARECWAQIEADGDQRNLFGDPELWASLLEQPEVISYRLYRFPDTLVHGDAVASNVLLPAEGQAVWLDWQFVGVAPGLLDLVVLYTASAYWHEQPPSLREMLNLYSIELAKLRVPLPWSSAMDEGLDAMLVWYVAVWWLPQVVRFNLRVGSEFATRFYLGIVRPAEDALARLLA